MNTSTKAGLAIAAVGGMFVASIALGVRKGKKQATLERSRKQNLATLTKKLAEKEKRQRSRIEKAYRKKYG